MASAEEDIDRLYGLPLDEFTGARDALARSLRADGSRAEADEIKRLRKPNLAAWALNRVRHEHPERVAALLAAGQRLQEAQQQLVSGGERGLLRDAAAEERSLVEAVVGLAERQLADAGHAPNASLQAKLWSTAHAAAAGTEAAELLRDGRLVHDYEISDLGLPATGRVATRVPAPAAAPKRSAKEPDRRARAQADAAHKKLTAQLERARTRAGELRQKAHDADGEAAQARRDAERAASALERAQTRAEQARARAAEAAERVAEIERSLEG